MTEKTSRMVECPHCHGRGALLYRDSEAEVFVSCENCRGLGYVSRDAQREQINAFVRTARERYLEAKVRLDAEDQRKKDQAAIDRRFKEDHTRSVVRRLLRHWGLAPVDDLIDINLFQATVCIWDGYTIEIEVRPDGADMQGEMVVVSLGHSVMDYEDVPPVMNCPLETALNMDVDHFWEIFAEIFSILPR